MRPSRRVSEASVFGKTTPNRYRPCGVTSWSAWTTSGGSTALRELFNRLRFIARTGLQWCFMPHDLPPWHAVYQQTRRWIAAEVFGAIIADLRELIRIGEGRSAQPTAMILDSRTLQSTPESGARAGWDGAKRRKGSKVHLAVDTLGQLLALHVTPANAGDRAQVAALAAAVQEATGETVEIAFVDQGYIGDVPRQAAADDGIRSAWPRS